MGITGIWPLIHYPSFEAVTGPKTDKWLVKTFGAILALVGLQLLTAAITGNYHFTIAIAGAGSAFILLLADIIYVAKKVISRIYLADAAVESGILILWAIALQTAF